MSNPTVRGGSTSSAAPTLPSSQTTVSITTKPPTTSAPSATSTTSAPSTTSTTEIIDTTTSIDTTGSTTNTKTTIKLPTSAIADSTRAPDTATTTKAIIETTTEANGKSSTTTREVDVDITTTSDLKTTVELSEDTTTAEDRTAGITTTTTRTFTFYSTDPTSAIEYDCRKEMFFDAMSEAFQQESFWDPVKAYIANNSEIIADKCAKLAGLALANETIIRGIANLSDNLIECANHLIGLPPVRLAMQNAGIAANYTAEQLSEVFTSYIEGCTNGDKDANNSSAEVGQQIAVIVIPLALVCALAVDRAARGNKSFASRAWSGITGFVGGLFGRRARVTDEEQSTGMYDNPVYNGNAGTNAAQDAYEQPVPKIENIIELLQQAEADLRARVMKLEYTPLNANHAVYDKAKGAAKQSSYTSLKPDHATYATKEDAAQEFDRLKKSIIDLSNQLAQSSTDEDENYYEQPVSQYAATAVINVNPDTVRLFQQAEEILFEHDRSQLPGAVDELYDIAGEKRQHDAVNQSAAANKSEEVVYQAGGLPLDEHNKKPSGDIYALPNKKATRLAAGDAAKTNNEL